MRKIAVNIKLFFFRKIIIIQRHWIYLRLFSIFSIIIFYEVHQKDFYCLLCLSSQCLKIIQKVSLFNIASKASFVYLLNFWIFAPKTKTIILAILAIKHTWNFKWDIFGDFHTACQASAEHKNGEKLDNDFISRNEQFGFQGKMMWVLLWVRSIQSEAVHIFL